MGKFSGKSLAVKVLLVGAVCLFGAAQAGIGDGGSKCADTSCTPAPPGQTCEPAYGERDECCPVWHCPNGQTSYGMSKTSGGSSFTSMSTSSGSGIPMNPFGGGFGGNPFGGGFGGGGNPFGNLFGGGGLFGRRR